MLRFCANLSLLFGEVPLLERFRMARQHGFNAVEIQFPYELSIAQLQQQLTEHSLKLVLFNVPAADLLQGGEGLAAVPEQRQQFAAAVEQAVTYAKVLRPEYINVLPGRCLNPGRSAEYRQTLRENLFHAAERFASIGVTTLFEAINSHDMPGFIVDSHTAMLEMLAELQHPQLKLQYDIYHLSRMGEDCAAFLGRYLGKIGHIQFADCPGRGQPGTGAVNFRELFGMIESSNYPGWLGAEYKPQGATPDSLGWWADWR